MARLNRDAEVLSGYFGLRYRTIEAERRNVKSRFGICYSDGTIKIRLFHATTGRPLKYSSLIDTLCHELAHLRHFDHGERFQIFYRRILAHARRQGIYRPAPRRTAVVAGSASGPAAVGLPTGPPRAPLRTPTHPSRGAGGRAPAGRGDPRQLALF